MRKNLNPSDYLSLQAAVLIGELKMLTDSPVVKSTLILQAFLHSTVDGGLCALCGILNEQAEWCV